uniref:Uncharacterized protein n=1 Tax=Cacopsylla melanoneura TaxID=428564 RepID=A0A8D8UIL3_9HEMI
MFMSHVTYESGFAFALLVAVQTVNVCCSCCGGYGVLSGSMRLTYMGIDILSSSSSNTPKITKWTFPGVGVFLFVSLKSFFSSLFEVFFVFSHDSGFGFFTPCCPVGRQLSPLSGVYV